MIAVTVDTDWAPAGCIRDVRSLLDEHGVDATFFSTDDDGVDLGGHERALHPNYLTDDPEEAEFERLTELYPDAVGVRSHSLYTHGGLQRLYEDSPLVYESNYIMYGVEGIHPFEMINGLVQLPIYFMDDFWMSTEADVDAEQLLEADGLKVFGFHPVHVYLNTPDHAYYERHKDAYQDPDRLFEHRYEGRGVRWLFREFLAALERRDERVATMREIASEYRD